MSELGPVSDPHPELPLPAPGPEPPTVEDFDPPLAFAGPARARPFRVAGLRAAATGSELRGVEAVSAGARLLTGPIRVAIAPVSGRAPGPGTRSGDARSGAGSPPRAGAGVIPASNIVVTPGALRRELAGAGGSVQETVLVPDGLAGAAVQWRVSGVGGPQPLLVHVEIPWAGPSARHRAEGGTLRVAGPTGDDAGLVLRIWPQAAWRLEVHAAELEGGVGGGSPEAEDRTSGGLRARAEVQAGPSGAVTLLVAAVDDDGAAPSLAALAALPAHLRRGERQVLDGPGVRLATGVSELDEGLAWARAAVRTAPRPGEPARVVPPYRGTSGSGPGADVRAGAATSDVSSDTLLDPAGHTAWMALAAMALGDPESARRLLPPGEPACLLDVIALCGAVSWLDEPGPLRRALAAAEARVEEARGDLARVTRALLADALEAAGDRDRAAAFRRAPAPPAARPPRGGGAVPLPTVGHRSTSLARALFPGAATGEATLPPPGPDEPPPHPDDPAAPLHAAAAWSTGRPDEAYLLLRPALARPFREGPPAHPLEPALAGWAAVTGLMGARPDAPYGRLRLGPALPGSWTRFELTALRVADRTLDLEYRRDGATHRWELRPTGGSVPLTLVFEPLVRAREIRGVEVDGAPAELERVAEGGGVRLRVQMPLDGVRTLVCRGGG